MSVQIRFRWADGADRTLGAPRYETTGAAGADIRANFPEGSEQRCVGLLLEPGARALVPSGFHVSIPEGYEIQIRPRSGLALKHGITVPNAPGTIDSDYRGLLGVILQNASASPFRIVHGDRIAQMVIAPVLQAAFAEVEELDLTTRGQGGFGSTGRG
jgi:dUTP pyrophosphatase